MIVHILLFLLILLLKKNLANGTMTNADANRIRNMLIKIKTNTELPNSINNFNDFFLMLHAHSASSSSTTSNTDATCANPC